MLAEAKKLLKTANNITIFCGAGVSIASAPKEIHKLSWAGLIKNGLQYSLGHKLMSTTEHDALLSLLSAETGDTVTFELIAEKLNRCLSHGSAMALNGWLESVFSDLEATDESILSTLQPCAQVVDL